MSTSNKTLIIWHLPFYPMMRWDSFETHINKRDPRHDRLYKNLILNFMECWIFPKIFLKKNKLMKTFSWSMVGSMKICGLFFEMQHETATIILFIGIPACTIAMQAEFNKQDNSWKIFFKYHKLMQSS